ncbi:MAG TPA: tetratricopeptide repeat protein [Phycisphaerae bacterium]|nr:tetratricopeptide repeat protein [Phycisphaerae bacterium]
MRFLRQSVLVLFLAAAAPLPHAGATTVVVVPLHDASPDSDGDVAEAVTDLVAGTLAQTFAVVGRDRLDATLSEQRLTAPDMADPPVAERIGAMLHADILLAGRLVLTTDEIVLALRLIRIPSGDVVRDITVCGSPRDLPALAADLAAQCADALGDPRRETIRTQPPGAAPLAGEQFFLDALARGLDADFHQAAIDCLKAIHLRPNHLRARLRLAESLLADGQTDQARITLNRTLDLFPDVAPSRRILALIDRLHPMPLQAVESRPLVVPLPAQWPRDAAVVWELAWRHQPARRDSARAADGRIAIPMPPARTPLDLALTLTASDRPPVTIPVRLWPADSGLRPPGRPLVIVDPDGQLLPLLAGIEFTRSVSCEAMPDAASRVVVAPAAAAALTAEQARWLSGFVEAGGQLAILGSTPLEMALCGTNQVQARWPSIHPWRGPGDAPPWAFMSPDDFVSVLARVPQATLLTGGTPWLCSDDGAASMIVCRDLGEGRLLRIAWPAAWTTDDPRCARAAALAVSDVAFRRPPPTAREPSGTPDPAAP